MEKLVDRGLLGAGHSSDDFHANLHIRRYALYSFVY